MHLFSCFLGRPDNVPSQSETRRPPGQSSGSLQADKDWKKPLDTYIESKKTSSREKRALKLLDRHAKQSPLTREQPQVLQQKLADSLPGYTLAFQYRQKLEIPALLAATLSGFLSHRFSNQPLFDRSPMQLLIREGGHDELGRIEDTLKQIWQNQVIDEKAAVRFSSAATPALLETLASPAGDNRLAFERLQERWAARQKTHEQPPTVDGQINLDVAARWAELERAVAAGLPHPAEQILAGFSKAHAPGAASTVEDARERQVLLEWLAPIDLNAMTEWMNGEQGREYANIAFKLWPPFKKDLDAVISPLLDSVPLAMWSLARQLNRDGT